MLEIDRERQAELVATFRQKFESPLGSSNLWKSNHCIIALHRALAPLYSRHGQMGFSLIELIDFYLKVGKPWTDFSFRGDYSYKRRGPDRGMAKRHFADAHILICLLTETEMGQYEKGHLSLLDRHHRCDLRELVMMSMSENGVGKVPVPRETKKLEDDMSRKRRSKRAVTNVVTANDEAKALAEIQVILVGRALKMSNGQESLDNDGFQNIGDLRSVIAHIRKHSRNSKINKAAERKKALEIIDLVMKRLQQWGKIVISEERVGVLGSLIKRARISPLRPVAFERSRSEGENEGPTPVRFSSHTTQELKTPVKTGKRSKARGPKKQSRAGGKTVASKEQRVVDVFIPIAVDYAHNTMKTEVVQIDGQDYLDLGLSTLFYPFFEADQRYPLDTKGSDRVARAGAVKILEKRGDILFGEGSFTKRHIFLLARHLDSKIRPSQEVFSGTVTDEEADKVIEHLVGMCKNMVCLSEQNFGKVTYVGIGSRSRAYKHLAQTGEYGNEEEVFRKDSRVREIIKFLLEVGDMWFDEKTEKSSGELFIAKEHFPEDVLTGAHRRRLAEKGASPEPAPEVEPVAEPEEVSAQVPRLSLSMTEPEQDSVREESVEDEPDPIDLETLADVVVGPPERVELPTEEANHGELMIQRLVLFAETRQSLVPNDLGFVYLGSVGGFKDFLLGGDFYPPDDVNMSHGKVVTQIRFLVDEGAVKCKDPNRDNSELFLHDEHLIDSEFYTNRDTNTQEETPEEVETVELEDLEPETQTAETVADDSSEAITATVLAVEDQHHSNGVEEKGVVGVVSQFLGTALDSENGISGVTQEIVSNILKALNNPSGGDLDGTDQVQELISKEVEELERQIRVLKATGRVVEFIDKTNKELLSPAQ